MIQPWQFNVTSPMGGGERTIPMDSSFVRSSGLRMQLTPEGDCREATFEARGSGLGVGILDCVQIVYGGTPLFFGEVRQGGNRADMRAQQYILRSFAQRFKEVTLPHGFNTPQQAAHLTVRAALEGVIASGQLPALITLGGITDLGFDCRPVVDGRQQLLSALLDQIVEDGARLGVTVVYGVNPNRQFFIRAAKTDVLTLTSEELTSQTTYKAPVAEAPVTAVLWYVAQLEKDGGWLTHLSTSAEASLYGPRVKGVTLDPSITIWDTLPLTYTVDAETDVLAYMDTEMGETRTTNPQDAEVRLTNNLAERLALLATRLHDRVPSATDPNVMDVTYDTSTGDMVVTATCATEFDRVIYALAGSWEREVTTTPGWYRVEEQTVAAEIKIGSLLIKQTLPLEQSSLTSVLQVGTEIEIRIPLAQKLGPEWELRLFVQELRAERYDRNQLDGLAQRHYSTPAPEPADIELRTFIPPAELPKYVHLNNYQSIVDAWEYRLTAARGMTLACLAGQAEDPAALAQADLIKARDGQAVITAITAGGRA